MEGDDRQNKKICPICVKECEELHGVLQINDCVCDTHSARLRAQ